MRMRQQRKSWLFTILQTCNFILLFVRNEVISLSKGLKILKIYWYHIQHPNSCWKYSMNWKNIHEWMAILSDRAQVNFSSQRSFFASHTKRNCIVRNWMWKCVTLFHNVKFRSHLNRYFHWMAKIPINNAKGR